uniref:Zinc finger, CCHC-type n=1 Tax=Tanacetum cinerariifolium TaxID=118510 RepID=A0A6L2J7D0_TANCI|nr:zinc finger, CCHC-type [Tanacetum cinerariifolium]
MEYMMKNVFGLKGKCRELKGIMKLKFFRYKLWRLDDITSKVVLYRNMGFNESEEYKKTFIGSGVGTRLMQVLHRFEFEVEPLGDHTFEVEPPDNVDQGAEDSNEADFAVATVNMIYAHESLTFNDTIAREMIFKWKAGLKEDMDVRSNVYVLNNSYRKSSDDNHDYYWELKGRDWTDMDVEKSNKMFAKIDKTLKRREQLRRLEENVGERHKTVNPRTFCNCGNQDILGNGFGVTECTLSKSVILSDSFSGLLCGRVRSQLILYGSIFYAPVKKAFRIYNKRTRMIIETIHVDFDKLTAMAYEQFRSGPGPKLLTPGTINLGLVPNIPSSTLHVPPTMNDWEILFQPTFDESLNPPLCVDPQVLTIIAPELVV